MFNANCTKNLKEHVELIEEKKHDIVERWARQDILLNVLREKNIEMDIFKNTYALGVIEYFIGILRDVNDLGNCPIIRKMLHMFADHHITSKEIFLICSQFKRSMINFTFHENIASQSVIDNINCVLDENFSGVMKIYDEIISKQILETLQQEKKFNEYNKAIDVSVIVSKADINGIITYGNQAFVEASGYDYGEFIGKTHSILRDSDTPDELYRNMWSAILSKKVWQGMIKNRAKDGRGYYVQVTIVPILDANNEISEFLSLRHEVTNLIMAMQKAQESQIAKDQFLANMSHELRTPLNAILGFSQIIVSRKETPDLIKTYVSKINVAGKNLLEHVNTILNFSKIESGKMEYKFETFELKPLFEELQILLEPQAQDRELNLVLPAIENGNIYGDQRLIKQVFTNLLSNAIKFTHANTTVTISYELNKEREEHMFSICDEGDGIDDQTLETLFEPFSQGENSIKNAIPGTGLGLAICKKVVNEIHKGDIWAENKKEGGACFYISIPTNLA